MHDACGAYGTFLLLVHADQKLKKKKCILCPVHCTFYIVHGTRYIGNNSRPLVLMILFHCMSTLKKSFEKIFKKTYSVPCTMSPVHCTL